MTCVLLWNSAVRVHDSQAYRYMDVTSRILELREILLSFQTGFNLDNAAIVCAFLECISGLEPSSVITEPRYLKPVTIPKLVNWYCEPSQPQKDYVMAKKTMFNLSPIYSARKSSNQKLFKNYKINHVHKPT